TQRHIKFLTRAAEAMIARLDQHILFRVACARKQRITNLLWTRRVRRALDHNERHGRDPRQYIFTAKSEKRSRLVVQIRMIAADAADELVLFWQPNRNDSGPVRTCLRI